MKIKNIKINKNYEIRIDDWNGFYQFINENHATLKDCIFRGQSDSSWKLTPSFFRGMPENYDSEVLQNLALHVQLENFKIHTRGRHAIQYNTPNEDEQCWWALGQHYGLKTPLLDWAKSPYVAAFFSCISEKKVNSSAVYVLDIKKISGIVESHRERAEIPKIEIIEPLMHENARLITQRGLFTYINNYKYRSLDDYLIEFRKEFNEEVKNEDIYLKIIVPLTCRKDFLEKLNLMNINMATLFPDLHGSTSYCNFLLETQTREI